MASRLKWVKASLREVIQDGRKYCGHSDQRLFPKDQGMVFRYHQKDTHRYNGTRERRRVAPADFAHKFLQNGSTLKEVVYNLINRVYQRAAIDSYVYVDVLRVCSKQKDLELLERLHDSIKKDGLEQNPYVACSLLKCYVGCGKLLNAQELFNKLSRKDIVSWNIMIGGYVEHDQNEGAIEIYKQMRNEGGQPTAITYLSALKACASPLSLTWGKDIHAHIIQDGFHADVRVGTALVHMYAKCGSIEDARAVFDRMEMRNLISWNAMIGGLAQHGYGHAAFSLFRQMQREGFTPDFLTYLSILRAKADPKDLAWVKEVHSYATKSGLAQDFRVTTALVHMYCKCGSVDDARMVFDRMSQRDAVSWNAIIGGLALCGQGQEAFSLFHQMQREGFTPNSNTYLSILSARADQEDLAWVKEVHSHAARSKFGNDVRVNNSLIHMYARCGSMDGAKLVFDSMVNRDIISWNVMIGGLAQHGLGHEAFSLFLQMQREGFIPDSFTYVEILNPCSSTGALEWVKEVHALSMRTGLDVDLRVGNSLAHMYAKIGIIADAKQVFDRMSHRDVISWTVIISGFAHHGHGREALKLFKEMKVTGVQPNGPLFVALLSACSHAGLVDEGRFHFESMTQDDGNEPTLEHYTGMVDILGRAGHLEEAKLLLLNMPITPDTVTWKALLGACRIYSNIKLAELAAKECLKLEPMHPSPYVLLSNIYAAVGDYD